MAALEPFQPLVHSGVAGSTQTVALGAGSATSQTINVASSISQQQTSIQVNLVNNNAAAAGAALTAYVRLSVESSTTIAATVTDCPISAGPGLSTVRLFASPSPGGAFNIAVIVSATPTTAGYIQFTPGQGGIGT